MELACRDKHIFGMATSHGDGRVEQLLEMVTFLLQRSCERAALVLSQHWHSHFHCLKPVIGQRVGGTRAHIGDGAWRQTLELHLGGCLSPLGRMTDSLSARWLYFAFGGNGWEPMQELTDNLVPCAGARVDTVSNCQQVTLIPTLARGFKGALLFCQHSEIVDKGGDCTFRLGSQAHRAEKGGDWTNLPTDRHRGGPKKWLPVKGRFN